MHFPSFPLLSEEDPLETSEGGLDPLGLDPIAEALAVRLVPGVRERMGHPRFLTLMAVGAEVCGRFDEDMLAKDGISPPWQVFEWLAVQGFALTLPPGQARENFTLPGTQKVKASLREAIPLSARRYLKNARVAGFHGVYRGLAKDLKIEDTERLGETGHELLLAWSKEQGIPGFVGSGGGEGEKDRQHLFEAVRDSLHLGAVDRSISWAYWRFFRDYLSPDACGDSEKAVLVRALNCETAGFVPK